MDGRTCTQCGCKVRTKHAKCFTCREKENAGRSNRVKKRRDKVRTIHVLNSMGAEGRAVSVPEEPWL